MIELVPIGSNGTSLDLFSDVSFTFNGVNPMFDIESIDRVFIYPIKLPYTPFNKKQFKYCHRLDVKNKNIKIPATLSINGVPFETGTLRIKNILNTGYEVDFIKDGRDLLNKLAALTLSAILPTIDTGRQGNLYYDFIAHYPSISPNPLCFGFQLGDKKYIEYLPSGSTDITTLFNTLIDRINTDYPGVASLIFPDSKIGVRIYSNYDELAEIGLAEESKGIRYVNNYAYNQRYLMYLMHMFIKGQNDTSDIVCFPTMKNQKLFDPSENRLWKGYVNVMTKADGYSPDADHPEEYYMTNGSWEDKTADHAYIPMIKLPGLFNYIFFEKLGIMLFGDAWNNVDMQNLVIYNNRTLGLHRKFYVKSTYDLDVEDDKDSYYGPQDWIDSYKYLIKLGEHAPDLNGKELFIAFLSVFELHWRFDGSDVIIIKNQDQLNEAIEDWTEKCEPNYTLKTSENDGWYLTFPTIETDTLPNPNYPYIAANGKTLQIDKAIGIPSKMIKEEAVLTTAHFFVENELERIITWRIPEMAHSGGPTAKAGKQLNFMYWRGISESPGGPDSWYPYASIDNVDYDDNVIGVDTLIAKEENGLYGNYYKGVFEVRNGEEFTMPVRLTIQDIIKLKKWKATRKKIFHPNGEVVAVVKSFSFTKKNIIDDKWILVDVTFMIPEKITEFGFKE